MSEPIFTSDLTMEQIEKNFEGMDFFAGLMEGLQEAYACEKVTLLPAQSLTNVRCQISMLPPFALRCT